MGSLLTPLASEAAAKVLSPTLLPSWFVLFD
jgi:hypothetical protein